jgi:hypothetical protein
MYEFRSTLYQARLSFLRIQVVSYLSLLGLPPLVGLILRISSMKLVYRTILLFRSPWYNYVQTYLILCTKLWNIHDKSVWFAWISSRITDFHRENKTNKLHGQSQRANYTDRATAACRQSDCQLLRIKGATWSAWRIPTAVFSVF